MDDETNEPGVAADGPPPRQESFSIDAFGWLVRSVRPAKGDPYEHRCSPEAFTLVAHSIDEHPGPFGLHQIHGTSGATWTQTAVALAFLKDRGVIIPAGCRKHMAVSATAFEDAMIEFHALSASGGAKA